uniref:Uncharacterized protein n=1 Tax=Coccidioides posadasii RMSCC 3488 TaxID=454284 RepID=A0A0J6FHG6_COCPO|nr:hypothetical protein CPAG_05144 [Coccidioides posadasii RMSCC 3488]
MLKCEREEAEALTKSIRWSSQSRRAAEQNGGQTTKIYKAGAVPLRWQRPQAYRFPTTTFTRFEIPEYLEPKSSSYGFTMRLTVIAVIASALTLVTASVNPDRLDARSCKTGCRCAPGTKPGQYCGCETQVVKYGPGGDGRDFYECNGTKCCRYGPWDICMTCHR